MAIEFATGLEMGTLPFLASEITGTVAIATDIVQTGTYSLTLDGTVTRPFAAATATAAVGAGLYSTTAASLWQLFFLFTDGQTVSVRCNANRTISAYVGASIVATSIETHEGLVWGNVQATFVADGVTGNITVRFNGHEVINFTGDTLPSAATQFDRWRLAETGANSVRIDNIVIRDDAVMPGDLRFVSLVPTADTATAEWTPSTGVDNYAMVDEIPASNADYVSTDVDENQDLYALANWSGTGLTPQMVVHWARALAETGDGQQLKLLMQSGATLDTGTAENLQLDARYFYKVHALNPNGSVAWDNAAIDALQIGVEAAIPA